MSIFQTLSLASLAAAANHINSQTALAQGITAQKRGAEVEALTYYYQAAAVDNITDVLTIRVRAVNGKDPQTVNVRISAISERPPPDNAYQFDHFTGELFGIGSNVTSIPGSIWGALVTSIEKRAFVKKGLTSVTIVPMLHYH